MYKVPMFSVSVSHLRYSILCSVDQGLLPHTEHHYAVREMPLQKIVFMKNTQWSVMNH